jgi:hypothetical protein
MGNTSVKAHHHGDKACTRKHAFRHRHTKRHFKRGGGSPLNPTYVSPIPATSSSTRKRHNGKKEPSLHKLLLIHKATVKFPRGPPKKTRTSPPLKRKTPVKRNFVVTDTITEEE